MDYSTAHFGKPLNDLAYQDIECFFQEERFETDQIEFKSINPSGNLNDKFAGIQKSVCAFLNSSGGLIIWGSPQGQKISGKKEKIFKGSLTHFTETIEKDYVVSKISDSIIPLPNNIRTRILNNECKTIVILEIDSSEYSPHQTSDTYYMRIDGQSKPAPHHYIEALFKKIKYPNIEVFIKIIKAEVYQDKYKVNFDFLFFNWSPLQNEEKLSFRVVAENGIFGRSQYQQFQHLYRLEGHEYFNENAKDMFYFGEPILESEVLFFDPYKVEVKGKKAKILISFGGRFSPRKSSEYTLDFNKMYEADPNQMVIYRNENKLTKDIQDEKGVNKEKVIQSFMAS